MLEDDENFASRITPAQASKVEAPALFGVSGIGAIRHWLVVGPSETAYSGPAAPDHILREQALDYSLTTPPKSAILGSTGPFGMPWCFHDPGRNEFVEFSAVYSELTVLDYYAFTQVVVPEVVKVDARFWVAGAADLWVNDEHITRFNVTRYRNPDSQSISFNLNAGTNRLCVRLQCLGLRDTRVLFGLFLNQSKGVQVSMPGAQNIATASEWIDSVRARGNEELVSSLIAPFEAQVLPVSGPPLLWRCGSSAFSLAEERPFALSVEVSIDGVTLQRQFELPGNRQALQPPSKDRRQAHLQYVAKADLDSGSFGWHGQLLSLLARRLLEIRSAEDDSVFRGAIELVEARRDCADFVLAILLRMEFLYLVTPDESNVTRSTALAFRYWDDEPGNDAMCFRSENHTLLFQGCQFLAGLLYPDETFSNSGNSGRKQAQIALPRIMDWLKVIESHGFEEFNSGTYMPITITAMLNLVDFSGYQELSSRMAEQVDRIFRDLAQHACEGGVVSPQGRIYRDVLFPERTGTHVMLAYATDAATVNLSGQRLPGERSGDWVAALASSPNYRAPDDLASLVREPVSRIYRHADVQIVLEKTPAYLLTSLTVPAEPRAGEKPENDLCPGGVGYQQHLWQASLGRDCHVFVNHPGGFFDGTKSRPGYWYGNGQLPRVRQEKNWLQAIHVIADGTKTRPDITPEIWHWGGPSTVRPFHLHHIPFTHAHWPADAFDQERKEGNWVFGQKGRGLIALWCSESLVAHDDILTGRELRAYGFASAWLVICGDLDEEGSLHAFQKRYKEHEPVFDREAFTLSMKGTETTKWWERPEPMPS